MGAQELIKIKGQKDQFGKIEIIGFNQFMKAIKQAEDDGYTAEIVMRANERVAEGIIRRARLFASTKMEKSAAATLRHEATKLRVAVSGGGRTVPYFGGANFGANRDTKRIIKAPNMRGRRSRATTVRHGEDVDVVARRIESQTVESTGKTVTRGAGQKVEVARTKSGGVRVIKGWNQFKQMRKGSDFFLYRAVTSDEQRITAIYQNMLDEITGQAFPDGA